MNFLPFLEAAANEGAAPAWNWTSLIFIYALIFGGFWFFIMRPQKKRDSERKSLVASVEIGDSIVTTSGFYGIVTDICDENVIIVEFGNNKNCRIVMKKEAIAEIEKLSKDD